MAGKRQTPDLPECLDRYKQNVYIVPVIKSFRDAGTERIFRRQFVRKLPAEIQERAFRKLMAIDAAERVDDLRLPPSNRLEVLKGDRKGQFSIRINDQWRVCFDWRAGNAEEVEIVDYH
jgi:proteic killer suppression protein